MTKAHMPHDQMGSGCQVITKAHMPHGQMGYKLHASIKYQLKDMI